jgi:hypothetical protein
MSATRLDFLGLRRNEFGAAVMPDRTANDRVGYVTLERIALSSCPRGGDRACLTSFLWDARANGSNAMPTPKPIRRSLHNINAGSGGRVVTTIFHNDQSTGPVERHQRQKHGTTLSVTNRFKYVLYGRSARLSASREKLLMITLNRDVKQRYQIDTRAANDACCANSTEPGLKHLILLLPRRSSRFEY